MITSYLRGLDTLNEMSDVKDKSVNEYIEDKRNELLWLLLQGHRYYFEPPAILSIDDIEIAAVPCSLFHQYLQSPPLAYLDLTYRSGMRLELNN